MGLLWGCLPGPCVVHMVPLDILRPLLVLDFYLRMKKLAIHPTMEFDLVRTGRLQAWILESTKHQYFCLLTVFFTREKDLVSWEISS